MAWIIYGYPPRCTISDNGAGNCRITFPAWDLDWEMYNDCLTDGSWYLANTTTSTTTAIIAKGGTESTGYWFDIGTAFPSTNWNNDDRIAIQASATISQKYIPADVKTEAVNGDTVVQYYANSGGGMFYDRAFGICNPSFNLYGGLSRNRCTNVSQQPVQPLYFSGVGLGSNGIVVRNITNQCHATNQSCFAYADNSGSNTISYQRCNAMGALYGFNITSGTATISNCKANGCWNGAIIVFPARPNFNNCTFSNCMLGVRTTGSPIVNNCLFFNCSGAMSVTNFPNLGTTRVNCCTEDNSGSSANSSLYNVSGEQIKAWYHNSEYFGDGTDGMNILNTSVCFGAGSFISGLTYDCYGNTRANPPSIGAHEGTSIVYPASVSPAAPGITTNILNGSTIQVNVSGISTSSFGVKYSDNSGSVWNSASSVVGGGNVVITNLKQNQIYYVESYGTAGAESSSPSNIQIVTPTVGLTSESLNRDLLFFLKNYLSNNITDPISSIRNADSKFVMTSYPQRRVQYPLITIKLTNEKADRAGMQTRAMNMDLTLEVRIWARNQKEKDDLANEVYKKLRDIQFTSGGSEESNLHHFTLLSAVEIDETGDNAPKSRVMQIKYSFYEL